MAADPYQRRGVRRGGRRAICATLDPTKLRLRILSKVTGPAFELDHLGGAFGDRVTVGTSILLELLSWVRRFARERFDVSRTRYLLYPSGLTQAGRELVKRDNNTVIWL